jgi:hypothetical protein
MRSVFAAVSIAALLCLTPTNSARANSDREIAQLIAQLADDKKASAALEKIVAMGEPAVQQLKGLALEKQDTVARGWAISGLAAIGGEDARAVLEQITQDGSESQLILTWAWAARIDSAKDMAELTQYANMINQYPALKRPLGKRVVALIQSDDKLTLDQLIRIGQSNWQLQQALVPAIISMGPDKLIVAMQTSKDNNTRRMAAAYLGNVAQQRGVPEVADKVVEALRFDPNSKRIPWKGGALFLPSLQYDQERARALTGQLIRWYLHLELTGQKQEQRQVFNNLRGVGLRSMVGMSSGGWGSNRVEDWLTMWAGVVGKDEVKKLMQEQPASLARYPNVLKSL